MSKIVHIYYSEIILPGGVSTHLLADREISVNSSSSIQKCVSIVGYATIHNLKLNDSVVNQNHTRQVMGCQLKLVTSNPANQLDAQDLDLWRTKILNKYLTAETLFSLAELANPPSHQQCNFGLKTGFKINIKI